MSASSIKDENGAVLRRMRDSGIDLTTPRVFDFEHRFSEKSRAEAFVSEVKDLVKETRLYQPESPEQSWDVSCRQRLSPTAGEITQMEQMLAEKAKNHGGYPDGWGSLSNPDGSPAE